MQSELRQGSLFTLHLPVSLASIAQVSLFRQSEQEISDQITKTL
ncbi:hypothetical protein D082_14790 [Synechocystis sp. PCC 6714]|nr:hypothetical protein D082_14790 [Synechocystis sp. PCC 6714]